MSDQIIERIQLMASAPEAATPGNIAKLLQLFINAEPALLPVIAAMFPNNPLVQQAVALVPTLLPLLQELESILVAIGV